MEFVSAIRDSGSVKQVLLMIGLLVAGPLPAAADTTPTSEEQRAKELFVQGNHVVAATIYEALWSSRQEPRFLFNAAMARELSGHELQAFVHLQTYLLRPELNADERREAEERLRALKARTKQLRLVLSPATIDRGALKLVLRRAADGTASDRGRPSVTLDGATMSAIGATGSDGAFDLFLEPGSWTADLSAVGYGAQTFTADIDASRRIFEAGVRLAPSSPESVTVPVTATFGPAGAVRGGVDVTLDGPSPVQTRVNTTTQAWQLTPGTYTLDARSPRFKRSQVVFEAQSGMAPVRVDLAPERRHILTITLGAVAGVGVVTGAAVAAVHGNRLGAALDGFNNSVEAGDPVAAVSHRGDIETSWGHRITGMRVIGAGLGLGVGALTSALEHRFKRPARVYAGEAAAGASLAILAFSLAWAFPRLAAKSAFDARYCGNDTIQSEDADYCNSQRADGLDPDDPGDPVAFIRRRDAGNLFGGVGVGLFAASVAGLVNWAVHKHAPHKNVSVASAGTSLKVNF